ncbi:DNA translocase FtsK [Eggerthellaceae bacterium zg-1084]|uniref:DNA translocase FtsK n=1 Tax=Berryella wangjianweii TaxID=2734634 RepID=UPI001554D6F7|nr:DNA translocase FtsK [Berryella wangjianweii]NPD30298.1 DNA translocase FtsK [Berryella wangjianweii]NPD32601.1 DNA translocase FtsK [Eggerthellaceae bacterium zg-997]
MAKSSSSRSKAGSRSGSDARARAAAPQEKAARRRAGGAPRASQPTREPVLAERARRDIAGISLIVGGLALLAMAFMPGEGMVTEVLSSGLRLLIGSGAVLVPLLLLAVGASMLSRVDRGPVPLRMGLGAGILVMALLVLLALLTPHTLGDGAVPSLLFDAEHLKSRGGYVGAGLAFTGLTYLGLPVSLVIVAGLALIGLAVMGLSASRVVEAALALIDERRRRAAEREQAEGAASPLDPAPADPAALTRPLASESDASSAASARPDRRPATSTPPRPDSRALLEQALSSTRTVPVTGDRAPALTRRLSDAPEPPAPARSAPARPKKAAKATVAPAAPDADGFQLPGIELLNVSKKSKRSQAFSHELAETAARLQGTLEDFGIMATVVDWIAGPTVTLFEVDLPAGVRVSRITNLGDDIALALAAPGVRIFAPIPGTHYVGIEVPNTTRENVLLGDILKEAKGGPLEMAIGKDVEGRPIVSDLATMPHLLIGGTTGSGKSVGINSMIMSMLMRATPSQVRFIMIDPKRVEFTPYNGIPHLYVPVVTEPKEAASALSWGVAEMERRLKVFSKVMVRNIAQYNAKVAEGSLDEEAEHLPYIVIIIDELADLMMNVGKEVEFSISRLAQLARAAGIHLIVATQRPSANVVTGLIKSNITNRMSFNVASGLDSRVILDTAGAESLIGNGDLLLSKPEFPRPVRIQGCYVGESEIAAVVEAVKAQGEPEYHSDILKTNLITLGASAPDGSGGAVEDDDPLIWEAADIVVATGLGSTSNIQRKLKVGYARAGRIMDMLEEKGVVGPANGSRPRDVLVDSLELETLRAFEQSDAAEGKE